MAIIASGIYAAVSSAISAIASGIGTAVTSVGGALGIGGTTAGAGTAGVAGTAAAGASEASAVGAGLGAAGDIAVSATGPITAGTAAGGAAAGGAAAAGGGLTVSDAALLAGAGAGIYSATKGASLNIPKPPPGANPPSLADARAAGLSQAAAQRAGMGFGNTIQNEGGPQGLKLGAGQLAQKTLLG